ncbi:hypothetical protein [Nitrospira moscoviensis]|uniref:Uncharacterized protein n=1 Tax=Nitrospira moscoviensis TaxID=42253 RepID=A0A0K2G8E8_NITMO|nr:hypothetical protein [Nitrospira moscoviensis]ALA56872.1 membrane protein of unknown function [Nitrospira moscoviensis]
MRPHHALWPWVLFGTAEVILYVSYQRSDARFHWFLHFFVGASAALLVMGTLILGWGRSTRHPLLWIFTGHMIAMFPDLLWNFLVAAHQPWMDVFALHITAHFIPGRNWTWYAMFLASLAFYLYAKGTWEAAGASAHGHCGSAAQATMIDVHHGEGHG